MRHGEALMAGVVAAAMVGIAGPGVQAQGRGAADELASRDRGARIRAVDALIGAGKVPDAALPRIVAHLRGEVEQAMAPAAVEADDAGKVPVMGDEVPPARVKADPGAYRERRFVMVGAIKATADIPRDGEPYTFTLVAGGPDGRYTGDRLPVRVTRLLGASLAARVARLAESDPTRLMPVRLKCTAEDGAIEASDWQFPAPGGRSWLPWAFQGADRCFTAIGMAGHAAAERALLDIITDEHEFRTPDADRYLKAMSILVLLEMPRRDRPAVARMIAARAKRARSEVARTWARRAYASLEQGSLVDP